MPPGEQIDAVLAEVRGHVAADQRGVVEAFVGHYFAGTAYEDLAENEVANLYGAALAHWNFLRTRTPGTPKLRVYNPQLEQHGWQSTHSIVEIATDDMPFLVDSVRMALNRRGLTTHLVIHPVMRLRRDADGRFQGAADRGAHSASDDRCGGAPEGAERDARELERDGLLRCVEGIVQRDPCGREDPFEVDRADRELRAAEALAPLRVFRHVVGALGSELEEILLLLGQDGRGQLDRLG